MNYYIFAKIGSVERWTIIDTTKENAINRAKEYFKDNYPLWDLGNWGDVKGFGILHNASAEYQKWMRIKEI